MKGKTYKFAGYGPVLENPTKTGQMLPATKFKDFMSAQDTAYVTRSRLGRVDPENPALKRSEKIEDWFQRGGKFQSQRVTGRLRIVEVVPDYYDSKLSDAVTRARAQLARDRQTVVDVVWCGCWFGSEEKVAWGRHEEEVMAPRKKSSSKQPNVGAWLGGNKGYVLSGSNTDTSAKADAGGG